MQPNRAAWFFAAGLAWLVLRGILVQAFPALGVGRTDSASAIALLMGAISLVASLSVPVFFWSFLHHHGFDGRRLLRSTTVFAAAAAVLSFVLVVFATIVGLGGLDAETIEASKTVAWTVALVPLILVASIFAFLVAFVRQGDADARLRLAAKVGVVGTAVSGVMIAVWIFHARGVGELSWYPDFSRSLPAKAAGLAAAATLLWFLESFAVYYGSGGGNRD